MLPKDPSFWIVVAVGVVIVVALAIFFGRGFEIGKWFIRVKAAEPKKGGAVSVGKNLEMSGGKVSGDIAGIKQGGRATPDVSSQNVDVLGGGKLKNVDIGGDITGVKQDGDSGGKA
jgi:hypothetical protein